MKSKPISHVAVAGAGPAGATAAYLLARRGFTVTVFDKSVFPRDKLCAGLLTHKTIRILKEIFGVGLEELQRDGIILNTCRDYRVCFGSNEKYCGSLEYPFHLVDRARYDHFWIEKANHAGVQLELGTTVVEVTSSGRLKLADGRHVAADVIVGADGVWSAVRRSVWSSKSDEKRWRRKLALTIEIRSSAAISNGVAALHFGYVPWGYAWHFPQGGADVVGICALPIADGGPPLKTSFRRYLSDLGLHTASDGWHSHPLPYGNFLSTPAKECALLVGDACGLADPLLGEGIFYAHRSAQLAAEAITSAAGDLRNVAPTYIRLLNTHVLRELRWVDFYRRLLFIGGRVRRFRGLTLCFRLFPRRLEALLQGERPFSRLFLP